jgi:amidohydrolase
VKDRAPPQRPGEWAEAVELWTSTHHDDLVAFRRHLHAHPELSGQEHATTDLIAERLSAAGWHPRVLDGGTGLVCDVGTPGAAPTVALRADIDGLAMPDEKEVPYRSQNPGIAHACGHDVHSTVVLGAGLALAERLLDAGSCLRLIFEPSEEQVPGGAVEIIDAGWLEGVRAVYGLHCDPKLDVGTVGTRVGPITSAADQVFVVLRGPGGHTARPQLTIDLVQVAARFATDLPDLLAQLAPGDVLLVWGSLRAGAASNVIPTTAHLAGTLRTPDRAVWEHAGSRVGDASSLGSGARVDTPRSAGADSFAWYLEHTGGTYARLGTHDPADPHRFDLHVGDFDIDERAIGVGVRVLAGTVARELELT